MAKSRAFKLGRDARTGELKEREILTDLVIVKNKPYV